MKNVIHRLASLRIAVVLLLLIVVALASGTIVESRSGTAAAARLVYGAFWFRALLTALALNLCASLVDLWPWGRARAGFVMTHAAILTILFGGALTDRFRVEGRLALWEGDESASLTADGGDGAIVRVLPFAVRLDAFEIDYYQGTERPAMFRSRVTVRDPEDGATFPAVIEMNRELAHAGWRLYQSGYQREAGRDQTVLLVSRDPGQIVVFAGYGLLVLGALTVLATRIAERAGGVRRAAAERARVARRVAAAAALAAVLGAGGAAQAAVDGATLEVLRRLPVQHDGRVMPFDTQARETVWRVTGDWSWRGEDPVATAIGWSLEPFEAASAPLVRVGRRLPAALGLPPETRRASFHDLAQNDRLMALLDEARAAAENGRPQGALKEALDLEQRLLIMQDFLLRRAVRVVPDLHDPNAAWTPPGRLDAAADLVAAQQASPIVPRTSAAALERELSYNRLRPSRLAWRILAAATLACLAGWIVRRRWLDRLALAGLVAGFGVMTWGLAMRWSVASRIPASNMYESLLFLGWGIGLFALVALVAWRNGLVIFNAAAMSALTMALADLLPMDPFVHPMPPVLSGTPWLAIHVPIIMVSYSVLALGVLVAHMQVGLGIVAPDRRAAIAKLNDLLYWYLHAGSILLVAGILTGSIWAASSWGRYWGWDPKEVWSLVAFLAYAAILHGRLDRIVGPFGFAALSIVAFWTVLMTYLGVNFVLSNGLHSYGFGGSDVTRWMLGLAAGEAIFLTAGCLRRPAFSRAAAVR